MFIWHSNMLTLYGLSRTLTCHLDELHFQIMLYYSEAAYAMV